MVKRFCRREEEKVGAKYQFKMLSKLKRMSKEDFPSLSKGAFFKSNSVLNFRFKKNLNNSKFSFSVSKKIAKNAVDRNRMRRQGYRSLEILWPNLKENIIGNFAFKTKVDTQAKVFDNVSSILKESNLI